MLLLQPHTYQLHCCQHGLLGPHGAAGAGRTAAGAAGIAGGTAVVVDTAG